MKLEAWQVPARAGMNTTGAISSARAAGKEGGLVHWQVHPLVG